MGQGGAQGVSRRAPCACMHACKPCKPPEALTCLGSRMQACRNFVQMCLDGYYDNTIFHRIIKDYLVQGGDPSGTGDGSESIYGGLFKDEFHTRLKFSHRRAHMHACRGPADVERGSQPAGGLATMVSRLKLCTCTHECTEPHTGGSWLAPTRTSPTPTAASSS